jgi:hypothetical protein
VGFAEGYIPRAIIRAFGAEDFGLSGDGLEFFVNVMRRVDSGYLSNENGVSKSDPNVREQLSVNNVIGVKNLLGRLGDAAKGAGKDRYSKPGKRNARKRHRPDNNNPA